MRQKFPAQFLDFVLSDFPNVRAGADLEKRCLGRTHSFASQCLAHSVYFLRIELRNNLLTRIERLKMHQALGIPSHAEYHLIAVEIRLWGRFCLLTATQPLPFSTCIIKENPLSSDVTMELRNSFVLVRRSKIPTLVIHVTLLSPVSLFGTHLPHRFDLPIACK